MQFIIMLAALCCVFASAAAQAPLPPLSGRVLDAKGVPIAGAAVSVVGTDWLDAQVLAQPQTRTTADGRFSVATPTAARSPRVLVIAAEGRVPLTIAYDPSPARQQSTLEPRPREFGDLFLADAVVARGKVRSKESQPLADAEVQTGDIWFSPMAVSANAIPRRMSRARTDAKGNFTVALPRHEAATLMVRAMGYYRQERPYVTPSEPLLFELEPSRRVRGRLLWANGTPAEGCVSLGAGLDGTAIVEVAADGSFELGVELPGQRSVWGLAGGLEWAKQFGKDSDGLELRLPEPRTSQTLTVVDAASKQPVADASVQVAWLHSVMVERADHSSATQAPVQTSDAAGRVQIEAPPHSDMIGLVVVRADGFATRVHRPIQPAAEQPQTIALERGVSLSGTVRDADDQPLAGARVGASPVAAEGAVPIVLQSEPLVAAVTDAEGKFTLPPMAEGKVSIEVTAPGHAKRTLERTLALAKAPEPVTVKLPATSRLRGKLTGVPIGTGWRVRAVPRNNRFLIVIGFETRPDLRDAKDVAADGSFEIDGLHDSNSISLWIPAPTQLSGSLEINLGAVRVSNDTERTFDLTKKMPGRVTGRVKTSGAVLPHPRVVAELVEAQTLHTRVARQTADEAGSFDLPAQAGTYILRVLDAAHGLAIAERNLTVGAAKPTEVAIDLPLTELRVRVSGDPAQVRRSFVEFRCDFTDERPAGEGHLYSESHNRLRHSLANTTDFVLHVPLKTFTAEVHMARHGTMQPLTKADIDPRAQHANSLELELPTTGGR